MSASDSSSRLVDRLSALAQFGGEGDGVTRIVYDDAWCAAHQWLAAEARAAGLAATADAAGNLYFHDPAITPGDLSRPVLLVGSHLDSVRNGGRFDGAYGTIAGLELAIAHRRSRGLPVVGFVTCEEEESRFHAGLMGARSLLGLVERDELDRVRDADGISWREALEHARTAGCAALLAVDGLPIAPLFRAALMLELHIEQGPVLEREGISLGIVDHIAGYRRLRAEVRGEPRHSGTTPMLMRHDALAAAAEMILGAEALARETGAPAVATAGLVQARPGLYNVVPGVAEVGLEVRHVDPAALGTMADALTLRCHDIAARRGVEVAIEEISRQEPTPLSPALALAAERVAASSAISCRKMPSGAAHDTMIFARAGVPSLLVFVPSRAGISHSPDEFTEPAQLETGLRFLSELITWLTESRPPR
jgi:allantoate deiminase